MGFIKAIEKIEWDDCVTWDFYLFDRSLSARLEQMYYYYYYCISDLHCFYI
jgi:hypothetical protein